MQAKTRERQETYAVDHGASTGRAKGLNGKDLPRFHLGLVVVPHEGDRLAAVDVILFDVVTAKAADRFHGEGVAAYLNLVALHSLLDSGADITNAHVDPGRLPSVSGNTRVAGWVPTRMPVLVASCTAASNAS